MRLALTVVAALLPAAQAAAVCSVDLTPVTFGTIDVMRKETGTGKVKVTCSVATSYEIAIGRGGTGDGREMQGPDNARLRYELYADSGHNVPWGDNSALGQALPGSSNGNELDTYTIHGVVPKQPGTLPGSYSDSPVVTLSF